jgi:nucleolar MIF4G domain-containing protein 1
VFNPYYALVGERFCAYKHSFKVTFQYALWDFLRELGEEDVGGLGQQNARRSIEAADGTNVPIRRSVNLAKLYAWLIASGSLSLIMLKTVTFTRIQAPAQLFFRVLFANIFLRIHHLAGKRRDANAVAQVFSRASAVSALAEGIRFFLHCFLQDVSFLNTSADREVVSWSVKVARDVLKYAKSQDDI